MNSRSEERVKLRSLLLTRLDAGSVDRQQLAAVQVEAPAQQHELAKHGAKRRAIVAPEVGDDLEVRFQAAQQPNNLDVAMGFALQPAARPHPVQIAVDVELQKVARRIAPGRPVAFAFAPTRKNPAAVRSSPSTKASINRTGLLAST
jgi:hypothetical protein